MPDLKPSWRKIEAALIELLREEGFELEQEKGNTFAVVYLKEDAYEPTQICIGDFAKELEQRL